MVVAGRPEVFDYMFDGCLCEDGVEVAIED
jgi:hypothetical protein